MTTIRPEVTDRAPGKVLERVGGATHIEPLAVTFKAASKITGLGLTTLWKYGKEKRIRLIRPGGTRRTLIEYSSLKKLLLPELTEAPQPSRRGRPRKSPAQGAAP
jgi:hypothetical protein